MRTFSLVLSASELLAHPCNYSVEEELKPKVVQVDDFDWSLHVALAAKNVRPLFFPVQLILIFSVLRSPPKPKLRKVRCLLILGLKFFLVVLNEVKVRLRGYLYFPEFTGILCSCFLADHLYQTTISDWWSSFELLQEQPQEEGLGSCLFGCLLFPCPRGCLRGSEGSSCAGSLHFWFPFLPRCRPACLAFQ